MAETVLTIGVALLIFIAAVWAFMAIAYGLAAR